uniref:hypothetical protein n=1 Tax=Carnobacterium sp. TaxID=48221 RepID=UPI0034509870
MIVLSSDKAKRTLVMMAMYLIVASLLIKGIGEIMHYNLIDMTGSLLNGTDVKFSMPKLPDFNMDNFSFDILSNIIREKLHGFIDLILPTALGVADVGFFQGTTLLVTKSIKGL